VISEDMIMNTLSEFIELEAWTSLFKKVTCNPRSIYGSN